MKKHIIAIAGATLAMLMVGCQKNLKVEMPAPAPLAEKIILGELTITDAFSGDQLYSTIHSNGVVDLNVTLPVDTAKAELLPYDAEAYATAIAKLKEVDKYGQYTLLPEANSAVAIKDGAKAGTKLIQVTVKGIDDLAYATYILPVLVKIDDKVAAHYVKVPLLGDFVPLSAQNQKPLPPGRAYTKPIKMVGYVETNDWDPRNIANFVLKDSKLPVFDMIVFFAANMNYNAAEQRRVLYFNNELQPIVNNPDVFIKPIRDRGIKVIMDILPNHQGVGFHNFQSYDEALDFAGQMKYWQDKTHIDGWDVDEEYAEYHKLSNYPHNENSPLWFLRASRETMPNTLLVHYEYSTPFSASQVDEKGKRAIDYLDYSWHDYGVNSPSYIGMPNERFGKQSIQASQGGLRWGESNAQSILDAKMGILMIFNMTVTKDNYHDFEKQLSAITQVFYGEDCIYSGPHYIGPKGK